MRLTRPGETTRSGFPGKWRPNLSAMTGTRAFMLTPSGGVYHETEAQVKPGSDAEAHLLADLGRLQLGRGDDLRPEPRVQVGRVPEAPEGLDPAVSFVMAF